MTHRACRVDNVHGPHYSWRFVAKSRNRVARRVRGAARDRGVLAEYVEGLSGEPARLHTRWLCAGLSQQRMSDCSRSVHE